MRHVRRETAHLLEARLEPAERVVEHGRQPAEFVAGIVYRQPVAQAGRGDGPGALGHALQRCERAPRQHVAPGAGDGDRQRQPEQEEERQLADLEPHERFRPPDLDDDRSAADGGPTPEQAERRRFSRHRDDLAVSARDQGLALGHRQAARPPPSGR